MNDERTPELDYFFVNRDHIGLGVGKVMWRKALKYASDQGWVEFEIIADPNAEQFYTHMGAKTIKVVESFPGRFVPLMRVELNND